MSTQTPSQVIHYPDSDGLPMSDNTLQFEWITKLVGGLETLFRDNPDVFVAGDLLWYPIEGDNITRAAPDAMVAFGRPKGYRGSYRQWVESGIAPQVVFEVRSPGNRDGEMRRKQEFYDRHGVEEYYLINPDGMTIEGWHRVGAGLQEIPDLSTWISPRLGIRFDLSDDALRVLGPDGDPFETYSDLARQMMEQRQRAEDERQRADRLAARLRALGEDPDA
jgi:Uma2 family endonuclease